MARKALDAVEVDAELTRSGTAGRAVGKTVGIVLNLW
jgi:hypothetical protein